MSTWTPREYPISHRDTPPGEGYERLVIPSATNSYDGSHTGGPWFHPATPDVIWKPLDGRPGPNIDAHYDTREDEALAVATGLHGFPPNWWVEERNGRRWLVRERAYPVLDAQGQCILSREQVLELEQGLRAFNARYWEINDHILVLWDRRNGMPFFADLSDAQPMRGGFANLCANDSDRWLAWLDTHGFQQIAWMRRKGREIITEAHLHADHLEVVPRLSLTWAYYRTAFEYPLEPDFAGVSFTTLPADHGCEWVITDRKLDPLVCAKLALKFAWGPIEYSA